LPTLRKKKIIPVCISKVRLSVLACSAYSIVHWQQLAFAYDVWQAAEQRKPTAHLPHPAAPMPTVRLPTAQRPTARPANNSYMPGLVTVP